MRQEPFEFRFRTVLHFEDHVESETAAQVLRGELDRLAQRAQPLTAESAELLGAVLQLSAAEHGFALVSVGPQIVELPTEEDQ